MPPARSPVDAALADLSRVFDKLGVEWFLFGAQAAILYGSTRVTEDIDVTVALGETTPRELVSALGLRAFALRVKDSAGFVERTRVLPILHLTTSIPVDIVFAGPGLEEAFFLRRLQHQRGRLSIPTASPEDIVVMKVLAGRPRDLDDVCSVLRARGATLDRARLRATLRMLEEGLGQSDLLPLFARLDAEAKRQSKVATKKSPARAAIRRAPKKRRD